MNVKKKDLLKLPKKEWNKTSTYSSVLVTASGRKHDSGYALMAVIGCDSKNNPVEIAAFCDDIIWKFPKDFDLEGYNLRNDMHYPSGIIQFWSSKYDFQVGTSFSSTDITLVKTQNR